MALSPTVLLTNDDGASSEGLLSLAVALQDCANVTVVAPLDQESRASRATPVGRSGRVFELKVPHKDGVVPVYGVEGTPAQAVQHALLEIFSDPPALVVSGINYGENVGITSTVSGTIGAILEASSWNLPAVAFSQEMSGDDTIANPLYDFGLAAELSAKFCLALLENPTLKTTTYKVDYPASLEKNTPWRSTFVSHVRKYDVRAAKRRVLWERGPIEIAHEAWKAKASQFEVGSDAHVLFVEKCVTVSPLTPDPTEHAALDSTAELLAGFSLKHL